MLIERRRGALDLVEATVSNPSTFLQFDRLVTDHGRRQMRRLVGPETKFTERPPAGDRAVLPVELNRYPSRCPSDGRVEFCQDAFALSEAGIARQREAGEERVGHATRARAVELAVR